MATYRAVRIRQARHESTEGWAVEMSEADKDTQIVSRFFETETEAKAEAARLAAADTRLNES